MKIELSRDLIRKLTFDLKPNGLESNGKLKFEANVAREAYFVFDQHRDAPVGFALKVASTKKVFVVQRKVAGRTVRSTLGDAIDLLSKHGLDGVRILAAQTANQIRETKANPSLSKQKPDLTLGYALEKYHEFLTQRQDKKISVETFRMLRRVRKRFEIWENTPIKSLDTSTVLKEFKVRKNTPTANEQAFKQASTAVKRLIDLIALEGEQSDLRNPFDVLSTMKMYRTAATLEQHYEKSRTRNPLKSKSELGGFLKAIWLKRETGDRVGCDYLLLTLLFAARRSETAKLKWFELLTEEEKLTSSYVDLADRIVHFYDTKNKRNHRIPIGDCAFELLRERQAHNVSELKFGKLKDRVWVFPAKGATNAHNYYKDPTDLLRRICDVAKIEKFTLHDLRRTWGAWSVQVQILEKLSKDYMNHKRKSTHSLYTQAEWAFYRKQINRVERAMLQTCPSIWNNLKPEYMPVFKGDDPIIEPQKQARRPGRPKKNS